MEMTLKGYRITKDGKVVKTQSKKSVSQRMAARNRKRIVSPAKAKHHGGRQKS